MMQDNKLEKFFPIGTVVLLKNGKKKVMITGFCCIGSNDKNKIYDYSGCMYPEGIINSNQSLMFNHEQIDKVYYVGLVDDEVKEFNNKLKEIEQAIKK